MVTATVQGFQVSFPCMSCFVNFEDDQGFLDQPQVQQITFSSDEDINNFSKELLSQKIQEYVNKYEKMIANIQSVQDQAVDNTQFTASGEVMR